MSVSVYAVVTLLWFLFSTATRACAHWRPAPRYYRRLLQMGVTNAELWNNLGLCCFYASQVGVLPFSCTVGSRDLKWYALYTRQSRNTSVVLCGAAAQTAFSTAWRPFTRDIRLVPGLLPLLFHPAVSLRLPPHAPAVRHVPGLLRPRAGAVGRRLRPRRVVQHRAGGGGHWGPGAGVPGVQGGWAAGAAGSGQGFAGKLDGE